MPERRNRNRACRPRLAPQRKCPVLARIRREKGLAPLIAAALGISREAVWNWKRVPAERVRTVAKLLGIAEHRIRPDLYSPPAGASHGQASEQQEHV